MKRLLIICLLCIFNTGVFAQLDTRATVLIGHTETLYHNETIYGGSLSINNFYISLGGTSNPAYDYHSYNYIDFAYLFNECRYFSIGPLVGYSHQKGYSEHHYNLFNYGCVANGILPLKGIKNNGGIIFNIEMTKHHTNFGLGLQVFF